MQQKSRYPGVKPFETDDQTVFFGRTADIDKLYEMISVEKTVLLYSESGLGKTSLINAGLIPLLISKGNYNYFLIRFGACSENNRISPKEKISEILQRKSEGSPLLEISELKENSVGYWFKAIQLAEPGKINVLIFDQFEELFTYPAEQITEIKKELNELIYLKATPSFRKNVIHLHSDNPEAFTNEQFNTLNSALNIRMVFSIRSDSLSYLNQLSDYLPNLQLTFYHLKPIKEEDARKAIKDPAESQGVFTSPKFEFSTEAVNKIIEELSDHGENPIATFQLQIVCQFAENLVLENHEHLLIFPDDLGDIQNIHQSFYDNLINGIPFKNEKEMRDLRELIEEKFIYEPEKRRWQVLEDIVHKTVSDSTLKILVESHLIRRESFQKTFIYELSHDTLVEPILKSYHLRKNQEELERAEQKRLEEAKRQRKKTLTFAIAAVICLGFAVFGGISWRIAVFEKRKAENALKIAQEKTDSLSNSQKELKTRAYKQYLAEGTIFKEKGQYLRAIQSYTTAKFFCDDTIAIISLINECKRRQEDLEKFTSLINEGDKLQLNEATYAEAMMNYYAAFSLGDTLLVKQRMNELNSKINIAVSGITGRAKNLIAGGQCKYARPMLLNAQRMKPDDKEVKALLGKCR